MNVPHVTIPVVPENPYGNDYAYSDGAYFGDLDESALKEIFEHIYLSSRQITPYGFVLYRNSSVDIFDKIGEGMEVKGTPVLRYNGVNYTNPEITIVGNVTTYTYKGTYTDPYIPDRVVNLEHIRVTLTEDDSGNQTMEMYVTDTALPTYCPELIGGNYYYESLPVRLIYQVGLTEESEEAVLALRNTGGRMEFYTNRWGEDSDMSYATLLPSTANPFYYDADGDGSIPPYQPHHSLKENQVTDTVDYHVDCTRYIGVHEDETVVVVTHLLGNNGKLVFEADPPPEVDIPVEKIWDDSVLEDRKQAITLTLYAYREATGISTELQSLVLSEENGWKGEFTQILRPEEGTQYYILEDTQEFAVSYSKPVTLTIDTQQVTVGLVEFQENGQPVGLSVTNSAMFLLPETGTGTTGEKVDAAITTELEGTGGSDTEQLAVVKKYVDLSGTPYGTVTSEQALENVPAGYYLIKDVDGSLEGEYDAYTLYIVKIVGDVTIDPKSGVPSVEKKVDDKNDSNTSEDGQNWQDSADYDIGDEVPFQIVATLPGNYTSYQKYALTFLDTMGKGLTFDANVADLKVMFGNTDITSYFTVDTAAEGEGTALTVSCDNLLDIEGITNNSKIVLTYDAILNEDANLGFVGNTNTVNLQFSNNPNYVPDPDGNPDTPNPEEPKGETPPDTVIVFTYKVVIDKVDNEGNPLKGAAFKLEKKLADGSWEVIGEHVAGDLTTFDFVGLDDGEYKLTETSTPAGYNAIDPIGFVVTAGHTVENAEPKLETLEGKAIVDGTIAFDVDMNEGSLTASVENNRGAVLPETGGIGTIIFYVLGGILVLGAVVLLVTKKRMKA